MSIRVMTEVWDKSQRSGTELLALLALSDWADESGGNIYPSIPTLAKKLRMSERNTQLILRKLEQQGDITTLPQKQLNSNGNSTNIYRINLVHIRAEFSTPLVKPTSPPGEAHFTTLVKPTSPPGEAHFTTLVKPTSPNPSVDTSVDTKSVAAAAHAAKEIAGSQNPQGADMQQKENEPPPAQASVQPECTTRRDITTKRVRAYKRGVFRMTDLYVDAFGIIPTSEQIDVIEMAVTNAELWMKCLKDYKLNTGWQPKNIGKLVGEYYANGGRWPNQFGNGNGKRPVASEGQKLVMPQDTECVYLPNGDYVRVRDGKIVETLQKAEEWMVQS